jgi:predicted NAD/FAD-dependent oxidoreductase
MSAAIGQPLWICGDWCLDGKIQDAFAVGLDVSQCLQPKLELTTPKG